MGAMKCTDCHRDVRPVFATDIDGTLAMYHEAVTVFSARYFDRPAPTFPYDGGEPFRDFLGLTQSEHRQVKLAFRQGGNKRLLKLYPEARKLIPSLREAGAEVWSATTRPWQRLDNIDPDTQEWLRRNGIEIDGLLYGEDKYQQLIDAVGIERIVGVFDDLADQIDIAYELGIPAFQIHRTHNMADSTRRLPGGSITYAISWGWTKIDDWKSRHESR